MKLNYGKIRGMVLAVLMGAGLIGGNIALGAEQPEIAFSTTAIRPGDFLQVQIKTDPKALVTVKFMDKTKVVYPVGENGAFIGFAATSYRAQPGKYPLVVEVKTAQDTVVKEQAVEVVARQFVEQRIKVSEKMRQNTSSDDKIEADARVGAQIREKAESMHLGPLWEGAFIKPLTGEKTSDFGQIRYVNDIDHGRHSGWDLAAKSGVPVAAMNRGNVIFAGMLYSSGNTVVIHHGLDVYTSYAHLSKIDVKVGDTVAKGQRVGKVGKTGLATGPHLHLTVRVGETPVDPALLLDQKLEWKFK